MKSLSKFALVGLIALSPLVAANLSGAVAGGRPESPGNSESAHENAGSEHSNGNGNGSLASQAGGGNAAHASEQGLAHASDKSMVGKVRAYAALDAAVESGELQQAVTDAQADFDEAYPDFDELTEEEQAAALDSPEGQALADAQAALDEAVGDRDAALAAITKSDDPAVKAYIDALLAD
jgi:signal transduction protein with GAF and PtsI domain